MIIMMKNMFFLGGVREALFGDEYYQVIWGSRSGFAKVALQTQVVSVMCLYCTSNSETDKVVI